MSDIVYIYADESCLGNQFTDRDSPGGGAALVELWKDGSWMRRDLWISEPASTNNRMALRSAAEALRSLRRSCSVIFTSDSSYLVKGMREWVAGWIARGWMRKTGPVENAELWKQLVEAAARHRIDWRWVRGHAGHPQNEYANALAINAAKKQTQSGGLIASGYEAWLESERLKGRYLDVFEFAEPAAVEFSPMRMKS
jgi:ribonuclease HI